MDHEPESIDQADKVQPVTEGDSPDTAWIPSYIDPDDGEEYLLLDDWDDEDEGDDEEDEDDDDDDDPDDEYFRELCESLLDAHRVEWFLDGGGGGDLTIDLRPGVYTLSGFERQGRDLDEDDDDDAQDGDGDGEGTIPDDEAEDWDDDEDEDEDEEEEWEEVEFREAGHVEDRDDDEDGEENGEVLLDANGNPVAFPSYVRLGYFRVTISFNGCADEGDIDWGAERTGARSWPRLSHSSATP